jgi:hypothetical protein
MPLHKAYFANICGENFLDMLKGEKSVGQPLSHKLQHSTSHLQVKESKLTWIAAIFIHEAASQVASENRLQVVFRNLFVFGKSVSCR